MAITVEGKDGIKFTVDTIEELKQLEELSVTSEDISVPSEEDSPLLTSKQLKEGDTVRILTEPGSREYGEFHSHVKGSIGIVAEVVSEKSIEVEAPGAENPSESITQVHPPSRLERVESLGKDANGEDLFEGDYVTGASGNGYTYTNDSVIMKVILKEDAVGYGIRANIGAEIVGEHEATIDSFEVVSERLIRLSGDLAEAKAKFSKINGEEVPEGRFKVGDKVRIVENSTGGLSEGSAGEVEHVDTDDSFIPYIVDGNWHRDSDLELIKEEGGLLPVGTKVRLLRNSACGDLREGEEGTISRADKGCASSLEYEVRVRDGWKGAGWLRKDDVEAIEEKTFKVGDKVRVVSAEDGTGTSYHGFKIGSIGEVEEYYENGKLEVYNGTFHQTLLPNHYEKVEPLGKDANGEDLYEGDYVTGSEGNEYLYTNGKVVMEVLGTGKSSIFDEANISVRIVGNSTSYAVDSTKFIKLSDNLDEAKAKFDELNGEEEEVSPTEFENDDLVRVTESFRDSFGDVAKINSILPVRIDGDDRVLGVGTVLIGDNLDKLRLVCRREDRKDIEL